MSYPEKVAVPVRLTLAGGDTADGEMYVQHGQRLVDLLNGRAGFVMFHDTEDGRHHAVNVGHIVDAVNLPLRKPGAR